MNIILIDNRDSFTFNLAYDLESLGASVQVFRNDVAVEFLLERAAQANAVFVLSPGPGAPCDAGACVDLVRRAAGRFGVLGICLGHQVIVEAFGGRVAGADEILHGRASEIRLDPHPLFTGLPRPFHAARYHSLAARELPPELVSIASLANGTAKTMTMAVAHRAHRIAGLQFHPESILTSHGPRLLANAMSWLRQSTEADKEGRNAATA